MSITSVAVPAEVDLESVDTFQAVLPESPNRANNNVRKKRRTSTKAVFSVYKADSKQYKSVSPRRRSSVHPRIANKLISQLSSNTLETGDMDDGFETREVDLAETTASGVDMRDETVLNLNLDVDFPYFKFHRPWNSIWNKFVSQKKPPAENTRLVHMYLFGSSYFYRGEECRALTNLLEKKMATVALKPMRFFLTACIIGLLLYVIYDISTFADEPEKMTYVLITKLAAMIPTSIACLKFTYTKHYWNHSLRQKTMWTGGLVIGITVCLYSFFSEGASYGVFGFYMGLIILLAPLYFGQCCMLALILLLAYIPLLYLADRRIKQLGDSVLSLCATLALFLFYRYKYLRFLREDFLVSYIMARQLDKTTQNKEVSSLLLHSMLPEKIIFRLNRGERHFADPYELVTVLFCEVCNFNKLTRDLSETWGHENGPKALVQVINAIYTTFDDLVDSHYVHKVETVGEVYMVVAGAPRKVRNHAILAAKMALSMVESIPQIQDDISEIFGTAVSENIGIHIGLNSGPIVAGVCGVKSPRYKLFGDTVNTASRMESTCPPGMVQASPSTAVLLSNEIFSMTEREPIEVKGKGTMTPFFVHSILPNADLSVFEPTYEQDDEFDALSADPQLTDHVASEVRSRFLGSRVVGDFVDSNEAQQGFNEKIKRTGLAFGWRAVWGLPHAPSCCRWFCKCKALAFATAPPPSASVLGRHANLEEEFFDLYRFQFVRSFRATMLVMIINMIGIYFFQDLNRASGMGNYCLKEFGSGEQPCKEAFGFAYGNPLCLWTNKTCVANVDAMSHPCGWVLREDAEVKAKEQVDRFISLRFYIYLPVQIVSLILVWFPNASARMKEQGNYQQVLALLYYIFVGTVVVYVSVLGGNPGHFTVMAMTVLFLNCSYLKLYLRLLWSIYIVLIYVLLVYFVDPGYRREDFCFNPFAETLRPASYIVYCLLTIVPQILVRETYLRSAQFVTGEMDRANKILEMEASRSTKMLMKLLPEVVVTELKLRTREIIADYFKSVTIVFTDMKGFTAYSSTVTPIELVKFLNLMYNKFDEITDKTNLYKVEIIGDAYYCVGGCPQKSNDHAEKSAVSALLMLDAIKEMKHENDHLAKANVQIRVGLHTGPVVAAVVGVKDPRYHLFGDSVNFAMKMESHGVPDRVHCSKATYDQVKSSALPREASMDFRFVSRGEIEVKGLGKHSTYFIEKDHA